MNSLADAIIDENVSQVRQILAYGVNLNELDEYGFTPLIEAAIADNTELVRLIVQAGADLNLQDMTGGTALHWASENNNVKLADFLLRNGANPNAYNFAGQPPLVIPVLRRQSALRNLLIKFGASLDFAQDFINAKMLGHIFELVGTANLVDPLNQYVEVDYEGFYLEVTLGLITESVAQYKNHYAARQMRRFGALMNIIVDVLERAAKLIRYQQYRIDPKKYNTEINALIQQEPLLIPVGYEGHAITFTKFGDIFVKCDRREKNRLYDNVMIYKMEQPKNCNAQFIKDLIYTKQSDEFINETLQQLLGLIPITELKVSAQISGNCSWANVEACIPVLMFLLASGSPDFVNRIPHYKSIALNFFHQWREWNKDRALIFCIQSFQAADSIRKACKAEILAAVLFQNLSEETARERERIEKIIPLLMQPKYKYILQNYVRSYCFEDISEEGTHFLRLLESHGFKYSR
jgi:hypothetical protein